MTSSQPPMRRPRSAMERHCSSTPILIEALAAASSASSEDVCEHLELVPSVARFLDEYVPLPALEA